MTSRAISIERYDFSAADALLVDTNVWLYVDGPQVPGDRRTRIYSKALANMLAARSNILVDVLILSEFVNRYSRMEFDRVKDTLGFADYKAFRKSARFPEIAKAIADAVRRILKRCRRMESGIETMDMDVFLRDFESQCPDFNDRVLAEICRKKDLKLVTHDGDYEGCNITILTANRRLLS